MKTEDPVIESLKKALSGRQDVRLAILFGSRARRGKARPDSDADVAVLTEEMNLLKLATDLSVAAGVEVDVVSLHDPGYPLLNAILRDGLLLHEAKRGEAAIWRSRAWLQAETDRPWFERMRDAYLRHLAGVHPTAKASPSPSTVAGPSPL
ncbi:MAG TPA: nucleotidyltransferase domain-containing protein [Thermoanaerobaculia bacterium]|nr:nucleotidyltransferase domain-containing protein [Thermoanaerobaculia bacterium]